MSLNARESLNSVRPGLKFDVAHPDRRPGDFHKTLYRDDFPTMEPFEIIKELLWGGFLAIVAVAWCVGIGYGGAWLIDHYGVSFRQLMKLAQGWFL